ncbi:MAG TPA: PD-(D/E)XK nuclease family protein [Rhizomicrobium sp.]|nr:PD-(D/E)XK nuclease family protein [Rhizomicrobium sp.]
MPRQTSDHSSESRAARQRLIGAELERCIYCQGTDISRHGKRVKKLETVQLWKCHTCKRVFTPQQAKGKTYPLKIILESFMLYYLGDTRERTAKHIKERFGITVPLRTLSAWLAEYRGLTTYARLRPSASARPRRRRVRSVRLHHQQVYQYRIHEEKLATILATPEHRKLAPVAGFLGEMAKACPHPLFQTEARASQGKAAFDLQAVEIRAKRNHACRVAGLVLQTVIHHKRRHDEIQRFMLATDSVTVAVEIPIFITPDELAYFREALGFHIPIDADVPLTGHIDFLQIRHGAIHILDYKPGANHERPIPQLMTYALALSRRTGLKLFDFVCAWFDENHYFEFYPLHVVHKRASHIVSLSARTELLRPTSHGAGQ